MNVYCRVVVYYELTLRQKPKTEKDTYSTNNKVSKSFEGGKAKPYFRNMQTFFSYESFSP